MEQRDWFYTATKVVFIVLFLMSIFAVLFVFSASQIGGGILLAIGATLFLLYSWGIGIIAAIVAFVIGRLLERRMLEKHAFAPKWAITTFNATLVGYWVGMSLFHPGASIPTAVIIAGVSLILICAFGVVAIKRSNRDSIQAA